MAGEKKRGANEPEPRPIIVKKIIAEGHGGHHGGAWKVAYADFVTAMMAFFLLMWLLGATTEKQRKGLADYFTPTLTTMKEGSAGSNGMFGGDSLIAKENYPTTGGQGNQAITIPRDATGTKEQGGRNVKAIDRAKFEQIKKAIEQRMAADKGLRKLMKNIRFIETREGLRIDVIDQSDFSMFALATDRLLPQARQLIGEVAKVLQTMPNDIIVRGHTDGLPYAAGRTMNNWMLSSARAEATRKALSDFGIGGNRFARIEGVADRDPFVPGDAYDPRNRRMSIVLAWSQNGARDGQDGDTPEDAAGIAAAARERDSAETHARELDMGHTALPAGAVFYGAQPGGEAKGKSKGPPKPGH
ncbi:flagellar motor protein MotB [Sphingobium aquiterrae]|uniref:flagellar motor protein MotB n=1 Tax=Sphingobium aquiterrae TaxID=2038656 RepID=UPI0030173366